VYRAHARVARRPRSPGSPDGQHRCCMRREIFARMYPTGASLPSRRLPPPLPIHPPSASRSSPMSTSVSRCRRNSPRQRLASHVRCNATMGAGDPLQILRLQPGVFRNSREHSGADLLGVMEGEDVIGPALPAERSMRGAVVPLHNPSDSKECGQDTPRSRAWPEAHAARKETLSGSWTGSPCSKRSARTRRASA
jgi:hypothetical protein